MCSFCFVQVTAVRLQCAFREAAAAAVWLRPTSCLFSLWTSTSGQSKQLNTVRVKTKNPCKRKKKKICMYGIFTLSCVHFWVKMKAFLSCRVSCWHVCQYVGCVEITNLKILTPETESWDWNKDSVGIMKRNKSCKSPLHVAPCVIGLIYYALLHYLWVVLSGSIYSVYGESIYLLTFKIIIIYILQLSCLRIQRC